jgi:hypothetical protein
MMDLDLAIELLIGNTERLTAQNDKINDRLNAIDITLVRLTDSVVLHEKRSTAIQALHELCKQTCEAKIDTNTKDIAKIKITWKTIGLVLAYAAGAIGAMSGIVQIISYK